MYGDIKARLSPLRHVRMLPIISGIVAALFVAQLSLAHTSITRISPANGSVLDASPPAIEISFRTAARMTSIVVVADDHSERPLIFTPHDSATSFKVDQPQLVPGRNEVRWTALSNDGHVISGTILLTIKPPAAAH